MHDATLKHFYLNSVRHCYFSYFSCALPWTCQVFKSVQMYKYNSKNDIYRSLFHRTKQKKKRYALIIRTVNCERFERYNFGMHEQSQMFTSILLRLKYVLFRHQPLFLTFGTFHIFNRLSDCAKLLWYIHDAAGLTVWYHLTVWMRL